MKTLFLILCLWIGLNHAMRLKKDIPTGLRRLMANVTSLDSFLRAMSIERMVRLREAVTVLNKRGKDRESALLPTCPAVLQPSSCPQNGKDLCTDDSSCPNGFCCSTGCFKECVPGTPLPNELNTNTGGLLARLSLNPDFPDLPLVVLDSAPCAARPVVVEVPQPVQESTLYFPFFVTLHRCGGACNARPYDTTCQPQATEDMNLVVTRVAWSSAKAELEDISKELTAVRMTNHTRCSCQCKVKPTDCDNRTQVYSEEDCSCQCKKRNVLCPSNFRWDPVKCQCLCDPSKVASKCTKRFQLDEKTCRCTCSTKPCKQDMKVRDPRTCFCKCPRIDCPSGLKLDRRTCECIGSLGRVNEERRL